MEHADERRALKLDALSKLPVILERVIRNTPGEQLVRRAADETFALVEQAWHLADLEEEGFAVRIQRLLNEEQPYLPDFDGEEIARQRRYIEQSPDSAVARFKASRQTNLTRLRGLEETDWSRRGTQENMGEVTLGGVLEGMLHHDVAHANQLVTLLGELEAPVPEDLVELAGQEPLANSA